MTPGQRSLLGEGEPALSAAPEYQRTALDASSWIDVSRGWLEGSNTLLDALISQVPWRQGRRPMYDRVLDDPRLSRWYRPQDPVPHAVLDVIRDTLTRHYRARFGGIGLNYYRNGRDSVAWHADRELRRLDNTIVAILTLGAERPFLVRSRSGGASINMSPATGDLLVMGGAAQRDWEHSVPKVARCGARVTVSVRWGSGDGPPTFAPRRGVRRDEMLSRTHARSERSNR